MPDKKNNILQTIFKTKKKFRQRRFCLYFRWVWEVFNVTNTNIYYKLNAKKWSLLHMNRVHMLNGICLMRKDHPVTHISSRYFTYYISYIIY